MLIYITILGVITKWKDVGELIMTGVNMNSFVHFDGSFTLHCKQDMVNSKLYKAV
jgi:hypothetical protein